MKVRNYRLVSSAALTPSLLLDLGVSTGLPESDVEVVVIVQPVPPGNGDGSGCPPGLLRRTAGAWQGEPLVREDQSEYEEREKLL